MQLGATGMVNGYRLAGVTAAFASILTISGTPTVSGTFNYSYSTQVDVAL
jgi:hypothetical protein